MKNEFNSIFGPLSTRFVHSFVSISSFSFSKSNLPVALLLGKTITGCLEYILVKHPVISHYAKLNVIVSAASNIHNISFAFVAPGRSFPTLADRLIDSCEILPSFPFLQPKHPQSLLNQYFGHFLLFLNHFGLQYSREYQDTLGTHWGRIGDALGD